MFYHVSCVRAYVPCLPVTHSPTGNQFLEPPPFPAPQAVLADRLPYAGPDTILAVHTNAAALLRVSGEKIDLPFAHTHSSMVYCTLQPGFRVPDIPACEGATSTGIPCGTRVPPGFFRMFHGSRARPTEGSERCFHQPQPQPSHQHWALQPKTDRWPQHASFRITLEYLFHSTRWIGTSRHTQRNEPCTER